MDRRHIDWIRRCFAGHPVHRGLISRISSPIDVFVTYDGKRAADITVSRYAVRHLVSGEVMSAPRQQAGH